VVTTAIAREMVGFIWAIARIAQPALDWPACLCTHGTEMGSPYPDAAANGETGAVSEGAKDGDPNQQSGA